MVELSIDMAWNSKSLPTPSRFDMATNAAQTLFQQTFGDEFDWVFFQNPCATTSATDSFGKSTGSSGCQ